MSDPLDSAIPVGSGPGTTVPPAGTPPTSTPPPPAPPPPAAMPPISTAPSGSDKIWAIFSHVSSFIGLPIILPVIVYLAMKDESTYVATNAKEALNFHLSLLIYGLACGLLAITIIAIPLVIALGAIMSLGAIVLAIIAAIKAYEGQVYRYPLTLRLIK